MVKSRFSLGQVVCTPRVLEAVTEEEMMLALVRHQSGDWGNICEEDALQNELALEKGYRLLSVYYTGNRIRFWVITEGDRSATTFLLPDEY